MIIAEMILNVITAKATQQDLRQRIACLTAHFHLNLTEKPDHFELQALVCCLAGIARLL